MNLKSPISIIVLSLAIVGFGCAPTHKPTPAPAVHSAISHPGTTPPELKSVAKGLDWIIVLAILAAGVGVGLYFVVPAAHSLSLPIAGVALAIEGISLVTRVSLWFVPWLAAGLALAALVFFAIEIYRNRDLIETAVEGVVTESKSAITSVVTETKIAAASGVTGESTPTPAPAIIGGRHAA